MNYNQPTLPAVKYLHGKLFSQKREIPLIAAKESMWTHRSVAFPLWPTEIEYSSEIPNIQNTTNHQGDTDNENTYHFKICKWISVKAHIEENNEI